MIGIRTLLCAASAACGLALGINASAATLSLSIDACDTFSMSPQGVITCNTSGGGGPGASCSLSPTNSTVPIGTNKVVTLTCTGMNGTPQITWGGCSSSAGTTCTVNLATVTTVTVTATANDGTNNVSKSTTVTSFDPNAGGDGGGGGNVPTTCAVDGSKVVLGPTISNFDSQPRFVSLPNKQTAVFPFVIPASGQFQLGYFQAGDSTDGTARQAFVAKTACDMKNNRSFFPSYQQQQFSFGTSTAKLYGIVDGQAVISFSAAQGNILHGKPGDTWYLMVQNKNSRGADSCATGACALYITPSSSN